MDIKSLEAKPFHAMSVEELRELVAYLYTKEQAANAERKRATAVLRLKEAEADAADAVEKAQARLGEVQKKIKKPSLLDKLKVRFLHGKPE